MSALTFLSLFETKSARVKGLAFHPRRSWILASLHNGVIQLWDYRLRTLIDRFGEHDGPVRSVDFHSTQPLFVSGGDDSKIKVWNYKERRCLFTLHGHLDYIRTVQFHHEYPWILSCSDDQCIRIWNWQSRQCIAIITGHGHYVMSAQFHPTEDLVVSASLDQTVRVWDISGLRKKNISPMHNDDDLKQMDIFGGNDADVKFVLDGHDRGVNWACFHPTLQYIISGADDRQIKLWRMNNTKAYELETLRGHYNNVSNIVFHPKEELMISGSEDRTLRVWDMTKRTPLYTHKRDHDRFWILAAHPKLSIFAAGHDSGLVVFKLERERAPCTLFRENILLFLRDNTLLSSTNTLRMLNLKTDEETTLFSVRRTTSAGMAPRQILSHPQSAVVIVTYSNDSGNRYELFTIPKPGHTSDGLNQTARGGTGLSVAWLKRDRFAVLIKTNVILINDLNNETTKRVTPPHPIDKVFSALTDSLLLRSDDRLTLYDVQQERVVNQIKLLHVKDVIWDQNPNSKTQLIAIISRGAVVLTNRRLETVCSVLETLKVKSGAWDENGTFIYSTLCHIKYLLPSGDHGIIRTLDRPIYITSIKGNTLHCLDRIGKSYSLLIDTTEYMFKHALSVKDFNQVSSMVKNSNLIGQAIIGYLQKRGHPEIALCFVKDEKTRFNLALECATANNIEIAHQSATTLNDPESWKKLGVEALRQGNHQVVEKAYQQNLDFEGLSHLYFITGNSLKLRKMLAIATGKREDPNAQYYNSLLLGDVEARVRTLQQVGQNQLAYMTAINHGLLDLADEIRQTIFSIAFQKHLEAGGNEEDFERPRMPPPMQNAKLFLPPTPIQRLDRQNWPITRVTRGVLDNVTRGNEPTTGSKFANSIEADLGNAAADSAWDQSGGLTDSEDEDNKPVAAKEDANEDSQEAKGDGWDDSDSGLGSDDDVAEERDSSVPVTATFPTAGPPKVESWTRLSQLAAHRVAAGKFDEAMTLLNQQIGLVRFEPLKPYFMSLFQTNSIFLKLNASLPEKQSYLEQTSEESHGFPRLLLNAEQQIAKLQAAYGSFTEGKFSDAKRQFLQIIQALPLVVARSPKEAEDVEQLISVCKEYLVGLTIELTRKDLTPESQVRIAELAAYFTHCDLNDAHLQLTLKVAINMVNKIKNYATVEELCNRLLALNPSKPLQQHAEKGLKIARSKGSSDNTKFNYDAHNPFVLCCGSFTPIYQGSPKSLCPFCSATYSPSYEGKLCNICQLAEIGKKATGFVSFVSKSQGRR